MLDDATKERIDADIASEDVVLYMKGTPVFPQCGFSAAVVGVLTHLGVPFRESMCLKMTAFARASRPIQTGQPSRSSM